MKNELDMTCKKWAEVMNFGNVQFEWIVSNVKMPSALNNLNNFACE